MLRSLRSLRGFALRAVDGEIGRIDDVFFEDEHWTMRYLVVGTAGWFGPEVLISPNAFASVDWVGRVLAVALTKEQVRNSPSVDLRQPVSRQYEARYYAYFRYSPYWGGPGTWANAAPTTGDMPDPILAAQRAKAAAADAMQTNRHPEVDGSTIVDSRLRSMNEVTGCHIDASNGDAGHVDDMLADDAGWDIRYLVVDTSHWFGGRSVLVPWTALEEVDWSGRRVRVNVTREQIQSSPTLENEPSAEDEQRLRAHYGR